MILALLGALWVDQFLQGRPLPDFLRAIAPNHAILFPPGVAMLIIGLLLVPLAARELGSFFRASKIVASRRWMTLAAIGGLLVSAAVPTSANPIHAVALVATVGTLLLVGSLIWHIRDKNLHGATAAAGATMLAFVYLGLMFGFLLALRREHSAWVVGAVLLITKSCDIGAYFTGKAIGRHKLIPWLSPGKTWEGLMGGMALAALVAMGALALHRTYLGTSGPGAMSWGYAALIGAVLAVVGQAGDLLESVLKRDAGLKDSGQTLPGYGGVLDVLDSILLAAPAAFWLLTPYAAT